MTMLNSLKKIYRKYSTSRTNLWTNWPKYYFSSSDEMKTYLSFVLNERIRNHDGTDLYEPKKSYSQCGEDLIVDFILSSVGIGTGTYIDIGCHHPIHLNNTNLLYKRGWRGINIDPIQEKISLFNIHRPEDVNICAGIGLEEGTRSFYLMEAETLSTFEREVFENYVSLGYRLKEKREVPFYRIEEILRLSNRTDVDLISIDTEGNDKEILISLFVLGLRPKIIICETAHFSPQLSLAKKDKETIGTMLDHGYHIYADTFLNTIFVDKDFIA